MTRSALLVLAAAVATGCATPRAGESAPTPANRPAADGAAPAAAERVAAVPPVARPPACDPPRCDWSAVHRAIDSALAGGAAPGAVFAVSAGGDRHVYAAGALAPGEGTPDANTVYDLASLTKVVGLTTLMMVAVDGGLIELDAPVTAYVPRFSGGGRDSITVRQLLVHAGGLPAWRPLHQETASRAEAMALAGNTALTAAPGTATTYSDLGIIVLTEALENVFGARLDALLARRVFAPLGMHDTRFLPPASLRTRIPPTENDPWRGRVLRGEVHDENAARLDGVAGHAGLFSTATDLLTFGEWLVARWRGVAPAAGSAELVRPETVRRFVARQEVVPGSTRALGWDTPSAGGSSGSLLSEASVGHTGFTGTSIWIDASRDLVIVLLSNRVHPTRDNPRWHPLRGVVADLVVRTLYPDPR